MNFMESITTCLRKYFVFKGRARRSEFWWWMLFTVLAGIILGIVDTLLFGNSTSGVSGDDFWGQLATQSTPISDTFSLLTFIPSLSVAARRLHDIDKSGWWQILPLAPAILMGMGGVMAFTGGGSGTALIVIGGIAALAAVVLLIVWWATDGQKSDNRFGNSPKYGGQASTFD